MGSCISKCGSKRKLKEDCEYVHDKLVISQAPPVSVLHQSVNKSLSPAPPSSVSSFSCSNSSGCSSIASSLSSSSSCSSSVMSSKDRSFSNEFLYSCAKENQHIIALNSANYAKVHPNKKLDLMGINSIQGGIEMSSSSPKFHRQKLGSPARPPSPLSQKQGVYERQVTGATPKKRNRSNSPVIVRQKSFRKEPDRQSSIHSGLNRGLRSPSPSRRFNGENNAKSGACTTKPRENVVSRNSVISRPKSTSSSAFSVTNKGLNIRPGSPNHEWNNRHIVPTKGQDRINNRVSGHVNDTAVGGIQCKEEENVDVPMEDIDNPHIALDCFIFL